ncbi:hypothetical protein RJ641_027788 [Dillenia turbinata]|uniref:Uncharacterized protein n=1 Tax=Dillenia turbinata TaxID=194707 RepID=A0AAN8W5Z6_9MAGN
MPVINSTEGCHEAVFAFPSHIVPIYGLVKRLAAAAPEYYFPVKPFAVEGYRLPEGYVLKGHPQEPVELFLKTPTENIKKALQVAVADRGREDMGVPWVALVTGGPFALTAHVYADLVKETFAGKSIEECRNEPLKCIPGLSAVSVKDLPEGVLFVNLESEIPRMLDNMSRMLPKATAVCVNTFEEIDPTIVNALESKLKKLLRIGPLSLSMDSEPASDEYGCILWLDKQKPTSVIYVGFGSFIPLPPNEVIPLTEALQESGFPFLWSVRGKTKDLLPKCSEEQVLLFDIAI